MTFVTGNTPPQPCTMQLIHDNKQSYNHAVDKRRITMKQELVKDWMTKNVITVRPDTTLPEAHRLMKDHNIRRLPVVNEEGKLIGIVTLGDVREAEPSQATTLSIWELNYLLSNLRIKEIMTPNPITISQENTIADAARLMLENKISALPVMDNGKLVGIITESDIFRMVVKHQWA
ncbi:MAG: CBS domain-containing protein [Chloroflexi bacterium]|nr:MAG: CBS domain-containing protein [Chloroflexota bacterium]